MDKLKVFFVDDVPSTEDPINNFLNGIAKEIEIIPIVPKIKNISEWLKSDNFPKENDFDGYSFAFIDVELDPDFKTGRHYAGGSDVLPYLRENAPWLPIIGYSKHFALADPKNPEELNYLISAFAGMYSFDIRIPRMVLGSNKTNTSDVSILLESAQNNRLISCFGESPNFDNKPEIVIATNLRTSLNSIYQGFDSLIEKFFWFSKKVIIEKFFPGYSGSFVLKAFTDLDDNHLSEESIWVIKVNKSPSKLHKELKSHKTMSRKGLPHAMMVPLLWPNVISNGNCAIIGYQFAKDFFPLSSKLDSKNNLCEVLDKISVDFKKFYKNSTIDRFLIRDILLTYVGTINLSSIGNINKLDPKLIELLVSYNDGKENDILDKSYQLSNCLIHGDLHCDNIMIKIASEACTNNVLFIDFAHSKKGPIVYDISKLFVDIIIRLGATKDEEFKGFNEGNVIKDISQTIKNIFNVNGLLEDESNTYILNLFIIFQVIKCLEYYRDNKDVIEWLISYLEHHANVD